MTQFAARSKHHKQMALLNHWSVSGSLVRNHWLKPLALGIYESHLNSNYLDVINGEAVEATKQLTTESRRQTVVK